MASVQRRNYPQAPIDLAWFGNDASSNYNAIQIKGEKRFSQGLQFLAHYTYSHADDFDSTYYSVNPKVAYGPDPFNRDHVFVLNIVYLLPVGKGQKYLGSVSRALDYAVGGWQFSGTLNWSSGLARPTSGPLVLPSCGNLGNARFDSFTGPSAFSSDFSLTKNFTVTERLQAQFRFDAYNIFNHPILGFNSSQGNTCLDCGGSAGQITDIEADASPNGMRQLQFGVRLVF